MNPRRIPILGIIAVQLIVVATIAASYARLDVDDTAKIREAVTGQPTYPTVKIEREQPLLIRPLYDDPGVVSDEELAAVLKKIRPKFDAAQMKPNHIEHALRTWRADATFEDPNVMSGAALVDFLTDHGKYLASWGEEVDPLLLQRKEGVAIRWGRERGASVHHDHWLACLTEAGVPLSEQLFTPSQRDMTMNDAVQEALRDLRVDEKETEWSALAFGLWIPPTKTWKSTDGRQMSFDMLARRLLRGHKRFGVCSGTHRVYSMMVLIRLDDEFDILSDAARDEMYAFLENVRDLISVAQFKDGRWPPNWYDGAEALTNPIDGPMHRTVIATGHHLEWLAIAPKELHPPQELIEKAADWIIANVAAQSPEQIKASFTFYSHVGNALALWRSTRPPDFWRKWRQTHPFVPGEESTQTKADGGAAGKTSAAKPPKKSKDSSH